MQLTKLILLAGLAVCGLVLTGCSTYVTPRYSISADTDLAIKSKAKPGIGVGSIQAPAEFNTMCRGAGPLGVADNITHSEYIKRALEQELKLAGVYAAENPRNILSGVINRMSFSSSRGLTGGTWEIEIMFFSSNSKRLLVTEHYEFHSGFVADTACKQTAEAFLPAVQDLLLKLATSPDFKSLVE